MKILSLILSFSLALTARSQTITTVVYEVNRRTDTAKVTQVNSFQKTDSSIIQSGGASVVYKILNIRKTPEGHMIYLCKSDGNYFTIWFMPKLQAVRIKNDADAIGSTLYFNSGKRPKE